MGRVSPEPLGAEAANYDCCQSLLGWAGPLPNGSYNEAQIISASARRATGVTKAGCSPIIGVGV